MQIGLFGGTGRMGRANIQAIIQDEEISLGSVQARATSSLMGCDAGELAGLGKLGVAVTASLEPQAVDVVIDFTLPETLSANLEWCIKHQKPIVIGTTGLDDSQMQQIRDAAQQIPVVWAANMSVGINLLLNLVKQASEVLGDTADIEIIEAHHRHKIDAPSGTAVVLGKTVADALGRDLSKCAVYGREGNTGEREQNTIGFATVRGGDVVGDHTVLFADEGERVELTHKASSRLTFAKGAVRAAKWLSRQSAGLYGMSDVLGF